MKLKLVSIFLLSLFCLVIAFPGYGIRPASKIQSINISATDSDGSLPSLMSMFKKCLSKGMNVVEEERNGEEDDKGAAIVFIFSDTDCRQLINNSCVRLFIYRSVMYHTECPSIFTPPDCFIS